MKKMTSRAFSKLSLAVAAALLASSASAINYSWNTTVAGDTQSFISTDTLGSGATITLSAYSTSAANAAVASTRNASSWINATFTNQGSFVGMRNSIQAAAVDNTSPQHAVDSIGVTELVVIDAGFGKKMDWTSFLIGFGQDGATGGQADMQAWTSGSQTATLNFNSVCFSGCANDLASKGFTTSTYDNVLTTGARAIDSPVTLNPSRYLVLAPNIGTAPGALLDDSFKLQTVKASTPLPPNAVPEPASLALLGLGLLGLGFARRRRAV